MLFPDAGLDRLCDGLAHLRVRRGDFDYHFNCCDSLFSNSARPASCPAKKALNDSIVIWNLGRTASRRNSFEVGAVAFREFFQIDFSGAQIISEWSVSGKRDLCDWL